MVPPFCLSLPDALLKSFTLSKKIHPIRYSSLYPSFLPHHYHHPPPSPPNPQKEIIMKDAIDVVVHICGLERCVSVPEDATVGSLRSALSSLHNLDTNLFDVMYDGERLAQDGEKLMNILACSGDAVEVVASSRAAARDELSAQGISEERYSTRLHIACTESGDIYQMRLLLEAGADPMGENGLGSPMHSSIRDGNAKASCLLHVYGASVECQTEFGDTPLHVASAKGHTDQMVQLKAWGASTEARNHQGMTPMHSACQAGQVESIVALRGWGADCNVCDAFGRTPVHHAAMKGRVSVLRLLYLWEARVNVKDKDGKTPHYYAKMNACTTSAILLRKWNPPRCLCM